MDIRQQLMLIREESTSLYSLSALLRWSVFCMFCLSVSISLSLIISHTIAVSNVKSVSSSSAVSMPGIFPLSSPSHTLLLSCPSLCLPMQPHTGQEASLWTDTPGIIPAGNVQRVQCVCMCVNGSCGLWLFHVVYSDGEGGCSEPHTLLHMHGFYKMSDFHMYSVFASYTGCSSMWNLAQRYITLQCILGN